MAGRLLIAALLLHSASSTALHAGVDSTSRLHANPIRKVVTMLQNMQIKITAEGKEKEELFDKYMCYCKNAGGTLSQSIAEAEAKIPQLEASLKEGAASKEQMTGDVEAAKAAREEAKAALAAAKALREKQSGESSAEAAEYKSNIEALGQAIPAIEKGMSGSFLQTKAAGTLRRLSISVEMDSTDRDTLTAFLTGGDDASYVPRSGEIVGILKQMKDTMEKDLETLLEEEAEAVANYDALTAAKTKEIATLTKAIEEKLQRGGDLGVELAEMANDLEDTKEALEADKQFLADLDTNCETKKKEWELYKQIQAEELLALADTIKVLNDDDALELFKKTLPSAASSFVQVQVTTRALRKLALKELQSRSDMRDPRLDFLEVALHGGKFGFDKIIKMIDELVAVLHKEQEDDDGKKEYCDAELDKAEDTKKVLDLDASDLEKAIDDGEEAVSTLASEIKALTESVMALDKSVAEATEQRKTEHDEFVKTLADNTAAIDLLAFAKNRLNKFYNPKLYKPAPKRELSEEERITLNMGGTLAPTAAPGGIAGTGIASLLQVRRATRVAPPPPPEAELAYKKKHQTSGGVLAMIDLLVADLAKDNQEMEVEEKDAQKEYEKFMEDAKATRAADAKSITDKEGAKAETASEVEANKEALKAKKVEIMETVQYINNLHSECDWLLKYYDVRKEARASEIDSLGRAKAVLSGADYSLLQRKVVSKHALRGSA